jgi:hypothetical protein
LRKESRQFRGSKARWSRRRSHKGMSLLVPTSLTSCGSDFRRITRDRSEKGLIDKCSAGKRSTELAIEKQQGADRMFQEPPAQRRTCTYPQPMKRERGECTIADPTQFEDTTLCYLARRNSRCEERPAAEFFKSLLAEKLTFPCSYPAVVDKATFWKDLLYPELPTTCSMLETERISATIHEDVLSSRCWFGRWGYVRASSRRPVSQHSHLRRPWWAVSGD